MKKTALFISLLFYTFGNSQTVKDSIQTKNIETVIIDGKKKIIERKVDRLIYNVENTMVSQGSSGTEILASTPLLKVDEDKGQISIIGKSGVSVMVNDRMLNLSGDELLNYLKNIRSENITKIEVITTPPAKYEAQGNSGIINIVLKKNPTLGWSGYLNSYYNQSTWGSFGGATALNYQTEKLKTSVKLRGYDQQKRSVENYKIEGVNSVMSRDERLDMNDGFGANINTDYSIGKNSNIGVVYDISKGHSGMDIFSTSKYFTNTIPGLNTETNSEHRSTTISQMLNVYYDQKLGEHKLSISGNYYGTQPETEVNFVTTDLANQSNQVVKNQSSVDYKIYSGQADLTLNFKDLQAETGVKYSQFSNDSDIGYFNFINNDYIKDLGKSNLFNYNEKNYAAYASSSKEFGEKWSAKAGLRYEYATTTGFSPLTNVKSENNYGKLFPTAYISYKMDENNQFSINYSKRINRPNFRALDPFRWYSNPYSYYAGNPSLQPSYNHNIELNYIFKSKFSANLFFQRTLENFDQISFLDGIFETSTYQNYYNDNNFGINLNYNDTFFKIWETNISTALSYSEMEVTQYNATPQNGNSFYYSINNTLQLNSDKTWYLFVNYWQSLPSKSGNSSTKSNGNLSAGFKMNFMQKALQMNISVNDIFKQAGYRGSLYFADNVQSFDNYWDARKLNLSVTYQFGNKKVKGNNRNIDFDDKDRAN